MATLAGADRDSALGAITILVVIVHPFQPAVEYAEKLTVPLGIYNGKGDLMSAGRCSTSFPIIGLHQETTHEGWVNVYAPSLTSSIGCKLFIRHG